MAAAGVPAWPVPAELAVLPDLDHPGGDQILDLGESQNRVALGVGAPVSDVHSPVARQLLEQQRLDRPESPLASLLVRWAHDS
jgi:hypothetical protein